MRDSEDLHGADVRTGDGGDVRADALAFGAAAGLTLWLLGRWRRA
jgi:hypothetical protein